MTVKDQFQRKCLKNRYVKFYKNTYSVPKPERGVNLCSSFIKRIFHNFIVLQTSYVRYNFISTSKLITYISTCARHHERAYVYYLILITLSKLKEAFIVNYFNFIEPFFLFCSLFNKQQTFQITLSFLLSKEIYSIQNGLFVNDVKLKQVFFAIRGVFSFVY